MIKNKLLHKKYSYCRTRYESINKLSKLICLSINAIKVITLSIPSTLNNTII